MARLRSLHSCWAGASAFDLVVSLQGVAEDSVPALLWLADQSVQVDLHKIAHDSIRMKKNLWNKDVHGSMRTARQTFATCSKQTYFAAF